MTLNNFSSVDVENIQKLLGDGIMKYLVMCRDEAPTTGTAHLHAVFVLNRTQKLSWLKSHVDKCAEYCRSGGLKEIIYDDGDYVSKTGERESKYSMFAKKLMSSEITLADICLDNPGVYAMHFKSFREIVSERNSLRGSPKPEVFWVYGNSGVGRTRYCKSLSGENTDVICVGHSGFVLGYPERENLILEDLRWESFKFNVLLNLLSDNSVPIDIKGGHFLYVAKRIFITTEKNPKAFVFDNVKDEQSWQLIRRVDHIVHCFVEYDEEGLIRYVNDKDDKEAYRDQDPSYQINVNRVEQILGFDLDINSSQFENRY
jgi:hypothetical protein